MSAINCVDFDMVPGNIGNLEITKAGDQFCVEWDPSYGVTGSITAKQVRVTLEPGKPS